MIFAEVVLSVCLGCVFLVSAVPKMRDPRGFFLDVLEYRVLPPSLARLYAWLVPPLQFWVAVLALSGTAVRFAAACMSLLLLSFIFAAGINMARGRDLDCHCFGKAVSRKIGPGLLLQDGVLLGTAIALASVANSWIAIERWSIFRIAGAIGLASIDGAAALLACGVVVACVAALSRASWSTGRRYLAPRVRLTGELWRLVSPSTKGGVE